MRENVKYRFIVNPKARSGKGERVWEDLKQRLEKEGIDFDVRCTKYAGHTRKIAEEITADQEEHLIVALGGDGTVNEVINGICDCSKVILGYIPTGSGNDFTRELHLPTDPQTAWELIQRHAGEVNMDIGTMECGEKKRRFAVSTGIGFDAGVCHQVNRSGLKRILNKLGLGKLSYLGVALKQMIREPGHTARISLDGGKERRFERTFFAAVMNHPYEGGGFYFCPDAKVDDGLLDVIVISGISKWKILFCLPTAFRGKHTRLKGIDLFQCRTVKIRFEDEAPIHTDGEAVGIENQLCAGILKEQIRVIVP